MCIDIGLATLEIVNQVNIDVYYGMLFVVYALVVLYSNVCVLVKKLVREK